MIQDEITRLRPLEPEDLEYLYEWENNMALWEVSDTITPFSRFTLKKYIDNSHLDIYSTKQLRLVIELLDASRPVGLVDLYDFDPYHQRAGLGILVHAVEDRGLGYASSAIGLMLDYAFKTLALNQVYCSVPGSNTASLGLFEKLGFTRTGYRKEWLRRGKEWEDVVYFQMLNK